jgi:hypothetical protein
MAPLPVVRALVEMSYADMPASMGKPWAALSGMIRRNPQAIEHPA